MNIYAALESRLQKMADEIDPSDPPYWAHDSENLKKLEEAWEGYLALIGVERVPNDSKGRSLAGFIAMDDPLYTSGTWLKIPLNVHKMIEVLGLP